MLMSHRLADEGLPLAPFLAFEAVAVCTRVSFQRNSAATRPPRKVLAVTRVSATSTGTAYDQHPLGIASDRPSKAAGTARSSRNTMEVDCSFRCAPVLNDVELGAWESLHPTVG